MRKLQATCFDIIVWLINDHQNQHAVMNKVLVTFLSRVVNGMLFGTFMTLY